MRTEVTQCYQRIYLVTKLKVMDNFDNTGGKIKIYIKFICIFSHNNHNNNTRVLFRNVSHQKNYYLEKYTHTQTNIHTLVRVDRTCLCNSKH